MDTSYIEDWCQHYNDNLISVEGKSVNLFVWKLYCDGLSWKNIEIVLKTLDNTCKYCYSHHKPCNCWNDE